MQQLKKSLGQHFLKDENISKKIVAALTSCSFQNLLEVGPGGGALTKYLLEIPGIQFRAVEIDDDKVPTLLEMFPLLNGKLLHGDILTVPTPFDEPFAVIGNFPYNISTQILFKVLEWHESVICMVGMFQKEVGQRVAAKEGSKVYGVTSVLTQAYFDVEYLFDVDETAFLPPPKIKSGVIRLLPRREPLDMKSRSALFNLVKTAFGQRRKMMRNACKGLFTPDYLQNAIFDKRAEQLSVTDFGKLTHHMQ